ncbi:hypothetical protein GW932_00605 [archaeon]|nr:hypothetical protein [archaeon]
MAGSITGSTESYLERLTKGLNDKSISDLKKGLKELAKNPKVHGEFNEVPLDISTTDEWELYNAYKKVCLKKDYTFFQPLIQELKEKYWKK